MQKSKIKGSVTTSIDGSGVGINGKTVAVDAVVTGADWCLASANEIANEIG